MSAHCPQDGGFVGAAGCTHPRRAHSPLVKKILAAKSPKKMLPEEVDAALGEGFYVKCGSHRVGFGKRLLDHINAHHPNDAKERKTFLQFAVATVRDPDAVERNHRTVPGRTAYAKAFTDFGLLVIADKHRNINDVFTFVPKRKMKK